MPQQQRGSVAGAAVERGYLRLLNTSVASPTTPPPKKADSAEKSTTGSTSTSVFLMYDVP